MFKSASPNTDRNESRQAFIDATDHEHEWGSVEHAHLTGTPHRKCQHPGCRHITLDLDDEEYTPV